MARTGRPAQWNAARIEVELRPIIAELGRMPSADDLRKRGLRPLRNAINKRGGWRAWAARMGVQASGASRREWTEERVLDEVRAIASEIGRMPTCGELHAAGNDALACSIPRFGGYRAVALKLGLAQKGTETHFGQRWERAAAAFYAAQGAKVERMSTRHPFDLRVNGYRVDVKSARRSLRGFAFAGLKKGECCDFFHAVCVRNDNTVLAHFVIPAEEARVHTLTLSPLTLAGEGKYAQFRDAFGPLLGERSKAA